MLNGTSHGQTRKKTEMLQKGQWISILDGIYAYTLYIYIIPDILELMKKKHGCRFLDPLLLGNYPVSMQKLVGDERLPKISPNMSQFLKGSLDFVGINHYTTLYARNDRFRIREFLLSDAITDSAVVTTCKSVKPNRTKKKKKSNLFFVLNS